MRRAPVLFLALVFSALAQDPGVFVGAPTGPSVRMFDPANPPIPITPPEVAITRFEPLSRAGHPQIFFDGTTLTVSGMGSPSLSANIMIFLPYNVTPNITEHENGHARLCQYEYARAARTLANAAWAGFAGMRFVGRGATPAQRQADAVAQIDAEGLRRTRQAAFSIGVEVAKLNAIYDNLTQHGNNPAIDTAKGEATAKQQFESAVVTTSSAPQPLAPARPKRSQRNKVLALGAMLCGGVLLIYGVWSFARS
jgi:hypothetical protein